uniref:Secreted protein n=1 Tax=Nelumbo nucifera TaxID=4432 RepID=A0A822ZZ76_NELNU|nr:TPA_asm: hypothetical protein HUJ06_018758 [Nelumbo nucifera]
MSAFMLVASYIFLSTKSCTALATFVSQQVQLELYFLGSTSCQQIDVWGLRTPFLVLEWIGMNAMLVSVKARSTRYLCSIRKWMVIMNTPNNSLTGTLRRKTAVCDT